MDNAGGLLLSIVHCPLSIAFDSGAAMNNGWRAQKLSDVCRITMGTSPPSDTYNTIGEGMPLINGPVEFSEGSFGRTIRAKFTTAPNKLCKQHDLILCVRGSTTGRMNIADFDACIGRGVAAIRAKEYQPWINWFIRYQRDVIYDLGTGATFPNITSAALANLAVPVPPAPEQRRIVGILDEAFDGIATAKANAEKNLQNARALFESHLNAVFTQRGDGWVEKPLGEVAQLIDSLHKTPMYTDAGGFPMVRVTDVRNGILNLENCKRVTKGIFEEFSRRHMPRIGDIVLSRVGTYGVPALVEADEPFCLGQNTVFILTEINSRLVYHFLRSHNSREQVDKPGAIVKSCVLSFFSVGVLQDSVDELFSFQ